MGDSRLYLGSVEIAIPTVCCLAPQVTAVLFQGAVLGAALEYVEADASVRYSGYGLVSDEICNSSPVSCGGACSNTIVTCSRIPTGSGDVWLNTGNSTCPESGYCVVSHEAAPSDACSAVYLQQGRTAGSLWAPSRLSPVRAPPARAPQEPQSLEPC